MPNTFSPPPNITRFVAGYLIIRTFVWTALLYFTQPALSMDVLEHLAWGREWRLVYAHHPGLPAWINEILNIAASGSHLAFKATAPVAASLAMLAVWLLARRITDAPRAAVATLSLEGVYYFNAALPEFYFNHNSVQLAAVAWLAYAAHRAFMDGGKNAWIFLG
ncbi:MAG: glycosyltransferase family 39 protein, partial [Betaproteobacteria bacterium]|nr:glycosyltransferase family 39 protein [Betaproteobacteria bacterium]